MPDQFDRTQLRPSKFGDRINRDYIAHCIRWGWAVRAISKFAPRKDVRVLDAGCGQDAPLAGVLSGDPDGYGRLSELVCVDLNTSIKPSTRPKWLTVHEGFNLIERWQELGQFDLIVSFEVIEHMPKDAGRQMLAAFREMLLPGGRVMLSTPVFNGRAAKNHVHEYTVAELYEELIEANFHVLGRWGTFMNTRSARSELEREYPGALQLWDTLSAYYDDNVLSNWVAPLFPDSARNNMWVLE